MHNRIQRQTGTERSRCSNYRGQCERQQQRDYGDDGFADRPALQSLRNTHAEILFHQPESAVIEMGENQRARAGRNRQ